MKIYDNKVHPKALEIIGRSAEWFWDTSEYGIVVGGDEAFDLIQNYFNWRELHSQNPFINFINYFLEEEGENFQAVFDSIVNEDRFNQVLNFYKGKKDIIPANEFSLYRKILSASFLEIIFEGTLSLENKIILNAVIHRMYNHELLFYYAGSTINLNKSDMYKEKILQIINKF